MNLIEKGKAIEACRKNGTTWLAEDVISCIPSYLTQILISNLRALEEQYREQYEFDRETFCGYSDRVDAVKECIKIVEEWAR